MRVLLFALLTGAVLQSQGQKFPKVVGLLPNIAKELPKPRKCPEVPKWFLQESGVDQEFKGLHEFLMYIWDNHAGADLSMTWLPDRIKSSCPSTVHIKATNMADACCQAAQAWPATWVTWQGPSAWIIVCHWPDDPLTEGK